MPVYHYWRAIFEHVLLHRLWNASAHDHAQPNSILGVAWTLCLEIQFYLAFVCLTGFSQRLIRVHRALPWVLFGPLAVFSVYRWHFQDDWNFPGLWHMFFLGAALYWIAATPGELVSIGYSCGGRAGALHP